jgi:hypothetical protein
LANHSTVARRTGLIAYGAYQCREFCHGDSGVCTLTETGESGPRGERLAGVDHIHESAEMCSYGRHGRHGHEDSRSRSAVTEIGASRVAGWWW